MTFMFYEADNFNQPLNNWNTSNVTTMSYMFGNFSSINNFNQPLNNWDTSNVTAMRTMFQNSKMNQDISNWCVTNISTKPEYFDGGSTATIWDTSKQPQWGSCN